MDALRDAVSQGHVDTVRSLLTHEGIDSHLGHLDSEGNNILHKAAQAPSPNPDIFKLLVQKLPALVHPFNNEDKRPLEILIDTTSFNSPNILACVTVLIKIGKASVKGGSLVEREECPLPRALHNCDIDMCRVLIKEGRADGRSILRIAESGQVEFIDEDDLVQKVGAARANEMLTTLSSMSRSIVR